MLIPKIKSLIADGETNHILPASCLRDINLQGLLLEIISAYQSGSTSRIW